MNKGTFDYQEFKLSSYEWLAENETQRLVVVHGMAEKAVRYDRFAEALNAEGISVFALDLPGHGSTSEQNGLRGSFLPYDWAGVIRIIEAFLEDVKSEGKPLSLFGHSMGSILSLGLAENNTVSLNNLILSAFPPHPGALVHAGKILGSVMGKIVGTETPSPFMDGLTFGKFSKGISSPRTKFDWLSRDPKEVDWYINDKDCGEVFTVGFFTNLARMTDAVHKNVSSLPSNLPLFYLAGEDDPVVEYRKGAEKVIATLGQHSTTFTHKIYPKGRHELLNDTCSQETTNDIIAFLKKPS